ncbi:acetate kinase [Petroclostridium sp. X23]|uniref:acetate/propionate family kinase n=1 Tax=Petroclostridium sp. X23 TaxID=3045146 RepID=UPI0024ADB1BA|nr:acetate kinase [Petroclostridium sp. X23]WHH59874.1 acetate kinase [Petroclostridium sp. X23]
MKILVVNAGSSSLKYQLINMNNEEIMAKGLCERIGIEGSQLKHEPKDKDSVVIAEPMKNHTDAIRLVISALVDKNHGVINGMDEIAAVGHRVVHGGEAFNASAIINEDVMKAIEACIDLAPLHNPPAISGIEACKEAMPSVPMVAVFDTAFHQTMPKQAYFYALPYELYEKYKIRRYGFHGTSHKYVAERAAKLLGKPIEELKIITCHLGNGSSITAVKNGKSIDTSMGFTPLAGVVMGTRSGDIDPAIVKFIMEKENLSAKEVDGLLNKKSGVLGLSSVSSDFRDIFTAANDGNDKAKLALDVFAYSVKKYIGEYAAVMGGVDAIVFTAGVGENSVQVRGMIVDDLEFMGIKIDEEKNGIRGKEIDISTADAKVRTLVIPTNEELMIALDTRKLVEKA